MAVCGAKMFRFLSALSSKEWSVTYFRSNRNLHRLMCTTHQDDRDPAPLFVSTQVQTLLKQLTRVDLGKVFRKRHEERKLTAPRYKFLTDEQLEQVTKEAIVKVDQKLQMPPVVKKLDEVTDVLSQDPELKGYCDAVFVFTDISYGVTNKDRLVVVRDTDGTLHRASREQHSRMNQLYFPLPGRQMQMPRMFQDQYLQPLLEKGQYQFVLDRACIQLEPDDPEFHRITAAVYDHVDEHRGYDGLRSTRHFGPLAFYLAWHGRIDNLLLDTIQGGRLDESAALVKLFHILNPQAKSNTDAEECSSAELVKRYIAECAVRKSSLELALHTYLDLQQDRDSMEHSIRRAHGT